MTALLGHRRRIVAAPAETAPASLVVERVAVWTLSLGFCAAAWTLVLGLF